MPQAVLKDDLQCFVMLIQQFRPEKVLIIGDMFHSHANKELELFLRWRRDFSYLPMKLIQGNHDILKPNWYIEAGIEVFKECLTEGDFIFAHDIELCDLHAKQYAFSGHIHPGISIRGTSRQSVHLACFYFGEHYAVLPAFSRFTGTYPIKQKKRRICLCHHSCQQAEGRTGRNDQVIMSIIFLSSIYTGSAI